MKFLFAINPVSGGQDKAEWEAGIQTYFSKSPQNVELLHLTGKNDAEHLRERIAEFQPDRVVAVGGDGTVKLVAEQLMNTKLILGILPAGSANGMAVELKIPQTIPESLDVAVKGHARPIDLIRINENEICIHLSDIGLNAQLIKYYQQNNLRGHFGYARGALQVLIRSRRLQVEICANEKIVQRTAFMVVLANASRYGSGAVINPKGDVADGLFEVVVLRKITLWEILKMFWKHLPFDPSKIEIIQATSLSLQTRHKAYFQVDGEYVGRVNQVKAKILPGSLKVALPEIS